MVLYYAGLSEGAEDYVVTKITDQFELVWSNRYGGDQPDHMFAMDINADGAIYVGGHTPSGVVNWIR